MRKGYGDLGYWSIMVTMNTYGRLFEERDMAAADALERIAPISCSSGNVMLLQKGQKELADHNLRVLRVGSPGLESWTSPLSD